METLFTGEIPYPWGWVIVAFCMSIFFRGLYLLYVHYHKKQRKYVAYLRKTAAAAALNRRTSFHGRVATGSKEGMTYSLNGNLVKEHHSQITEHYDVTNILLGRGSSAEVFIGKHLKTHRRYAVKIIDYARRDVAWRYEREMNILKDCDHTNIVRLFELYITPMNRYFVMDLCTGGHLGYALKQCPRGVFEEETAKQYILQILHAIAHCHTRGICHRDVKLQNILLESNTQEAQLKLIDFGNACRYLGNCPMTKIVGTTYTAAPEVFKESYDERCDVWSIGVVAYILLSGHRPFESTSPDANNQKSRETSIVTNILTGRYHFKHEAWNTISSSAVHFVQCCLEVDYTKRRSTLSILNHPWLNHTGDLKMQAGNRITRNGARTLSRRLARNLTSSDLRRTAMIAVAFDLPPQKLQMYREIFQQIDQSGNGVLERKEFQVAMETADPSMSKDDIKMLFDTIDQDGNNAISFTEFVAATIDPREAKMAEINAAFRHFDQDGKGCITREDLQNVLLTSWTVDVDDGLLDSESLEEQRIQKVNARITTIFEQSDMNKDGVISYTEFLFAMADGSLQHQNQQELQQPQQQQQQHAEPLAATARASSSIGVDDYAVPPADTVEVIPAPIATRKNHNRRQSDSRLHLSGKSFRQRASSIIFLGTRPTPAANPSTSKPSDAELGVGRGAGPSTTSDSQNSVSFLRPSMLRRMSLAVSSGFMSNTEFSLPAEQQHQQQALERVPSIASLMLADVTSGVGIFRNGSPSRAAQDNRRARSNNLQPVDNLEDSPLEDDDKDYDEDREEEEFRSNHRRMSAPGILWHTIKRRTSIFVGLPAATSTSQSADTAAGDIEAPPQSHGGSPGAPFADISTPSSRRKKLMTTGGLRRGSFERRGSTDNSVTAGGLAAADATSDTVADADIGAYKIDEGDVLLLGGEGAPLFLGGLHSVVMNDGDEPLEASCDSALLSDRSSQFGSQKSKEREVGSELEEYQIATSALPLSPRISGSRRTHGTLQRADVSHSSAAGRSLATVARAAGGADVDVLSDSADLSPGNEQLRDLSVGSGGGDGGSPSQKAKRSLKPPSSLAGKTKETRDSFTSVGTNSFDADNNSFTNDSSHSDADRLKELVRFLRTQQVQSDAGANGPGMETIHEADERRMSIQQGPEGARMIASLSNAFLAGVAAARTSMLGSTASITPLANTNQAEGERHDKDFVAKPASGRSGRRFSHG